MIVDLGPVRCGRVAPNNGSCEQVRDTIHRVSESMEVRASDVSKVGDVIDALLALRITDISPIQFSATDTRGAWESALREATRQARAKAEPIATASGSRLGRIPSLGTSADDGGGCRNRASGDLPGVSITGSSASPFGGTRIAAPAFTLSATVCGRWRLEPAKWETRCAWWHLIVSRQTSTTSRMAGIQDEDVPPTMLGGIQVETEVPPSRSRAARPRPVVVTDIQVPFGSLVAFIMKCALAAIPAFLLLAVVGQLVGSVLSRLSR